MKTAMKKQTITRTITLTHAVVKFVDVNANIVYDYDYTIVGRYESEEVIDYIKEFGERHDVPVAVVNIEYSDRLYSMSAEKFVTFAESSKLISPVE